MPDESFTITRKNNVTEKEGIQYMESLAQGFFFVDKNERKRIIELLSELIVKPDEDPRNFSRSFDMVHIPRLAEGNVSPETIEAHIHEVTIVELKCTRAFLPNNPKGFFFGATQNEFDFGERLGDRYRFCFVCLHPDSVSHAMLSVPQLEAIMRTKRVQYQINL